MDADGNIYVAMSEMGTVLRKFTPDGKLLWELYGTVLRGSGLRRSQPPMGRDVWGIQEHYVMDYAQAGRQGSELGRLLARSPQISQ